MVDDEIYIVHILEFTLTMEGYEVATAADGEEALRKIEQQKPDLMVLDIMMPKLDGYEVCAGCARMTSCGPAGYSPLGQGASVDARRAWKSAPTTTSSSRSRPDSCWSGSASCSSDETLGQVPNF